MGEFMRLVRDTVFLLGLMLGASLALAVPCRAQERPGGDSVARADRESRTDPARDPDAPVPRAGSASLTAAANNPLAPIPQVQFRFLSGKGFEHPVGAANTLQIQPMIPIRPIGFLPPQLVRITIPGDVVTSNSQDVSGLGNTQIVDIFAFEKDWGAWGIGPAFVLPSATTARLQPQWQLGVAAMVVYTGAKNWVLGAPHARTSLPRLAVAR